MTRMLYIGDSVYLLIQRLAGQGSGAGYGVYDSKPIVFERLLENIGAPVHGRSLR
jgi:hypothetical protein